MKLFPTQTVGIWALVLTGLAMTFFFMRSYDPSTTTEVCPPKDETNSSEIGSNHEPLQPSDENCTPPKPSPEPSPAPNPTSTPSLQPSPTSTPTPPVAPQVWTEISLGSTTKRNIIFTFDGGAGTQSLDQILNVLNSYDLVATFFITGRWVDTNSAAVRRIAEGGHEVFNHTNSHPYLTRLTDAEILAELQTAEKKISGITRKSTKPYFRPPYGDRNARVLATAKEAGYRSVYWTVDALDWKESEGVSDEAVKQRIYASLKPGAIILMHIGDTITGRVLEEVILEIKSRGYTIVPLSKGL